MEGDWWLRYTQYMNYIPLLEVDERDLPTGRQVTKQVAHDEKIIHRCVAVYVFDAQGNLYVQVHKKSKGMLDHSVGGHVDGDETYLDAAYREMYEELGLDGVELHEIATKYLSNEHRHIHMFGIFECQAHENWTFQPNEEVGEIFTKSLPDIVNDMNQSPDKYTGGFLNTMKKYLEVKNIDLDLRIN